MFFLRHTFASVSIAAMLFAAVSCSSKTESTVAEAPIHNTLSDQEKSEGWKLLFDGETTNGWRKYNADKIGSAWKVQDGTLALDASQKDDWQTMNGGDIVSENEYDNFELKLEWKIDSCGNSGIIFNAVEDPKYKYAWETGSEMQVVDNTCHPDGKIEKHRAGDLYDLVASKAIQVTPTQEWNQVRIISNDSQYQFWLNGIQVVEFKMHTPEWDSMIKNSVFKDMPDYAKSTKGHIVLQDHGANVWFRNIKIREIKK